VLFRFANTNRTRVYRISAAAAADIRVTALRRPFLRVPHL